jgi:hypothetical protein
MSKESSGCGYSSLCMVVFLVFLILKLTGVGQIAQWSWWWVTSPLWILPAIVLVVTVLIIVLKIIS